MNDIFNRWMETEDGVKVLIIGASARAAAHSALRAQHEVAALDLFVDRDLAEFVPCEAIDQFPDSIVEQASRWPDHAIFCCGGMENYPAVVAELERNRTVIGPSATQIMELRNLSRLQSWLNDPRGHRKLRLPEGRYQTSSQSCEGGSLKAFNQYPWLWKPYQSAGGIRIKAVTSDAELDFDSGYLQKFIPGSVLGITFLCLPSETILLAAMRNVSSNELHSKSDIQSNFPAYQYTASFGPIDMDVPSSTLLEQSIHSIATSIQYRGLLQADCIFGDDGNWYFLEFNPRWSASMELIEMCFDVNLFEAQRLAQLHEQSIVSAKSTTDFRPRYHAMKRIVYAREACTISEESSNFIFARSSHHANNPISVGWSDVPYPGTIIKSGQPIATAWARQVRAEQPVLKSPPNQWDFDYDLSKEIDLLIAELALKTL